MIIPLRREAHAEPLGDPATITKIAPCVLGIIPRCIVERCKVNLNLRHLRCIFNEYIFWHFFQDHLGLFTVTIRNHSNPQFRLVISSVFPERIKDGEKLRVQGRLATEYSDPFPAVSTLHTLIDELIDLLQAYAFIRRCFV